jgi:hypothetical protein
MSQFNGLKVGDKVMANGYEGLVSALCEWDSDKELVEVRMDRGEICTSCYEVEKV